MNKKIVMVGGCGRSGTSATSGMLHKGGISMGKKLPYKSNINVKGYFEDHLIRKLMFDLSRFMGSPDKSFTTTSDRGMRNVYEACMFNFEKFFTQGDVSKLQFVADYISSRELEGSFNWGLKHPFISFTLPLVYYYASQLGDVYVIECRRNEQCVGNSYKAFTGNYDNAILFAKICRNLIQENARYCDVPILTVHFEDTIENPEKQYHRIEDFLGMKLKEDGWTHIEKKLCHHGGK